MTLPGRRAKITICVATYNQRPYIKDCLMSLLMQSCEAELEILVGDDCSTDGTGAVISEVAAAYPGRLKIPDRPTNLGPSKNYQDLIRRAGGGYIAHIDGDDYWMPNKLAEQLAHFEKNPASIAVYSNAHIIDETGQMTGVFNNAQPETFDMDYLLRRGNFLNHSSMIYRAEFKQCLLDLTGDFIDYRMHLRLSRHGRLGYVNKDLVAYRAGSTTSMIKNAPDKVDLLYWEAITDPGTSSTLKASRTSAQAHFYSRIFYNSVRRRRFFYARQWAIRIRSECPNQANQIFLRSAPLILSALERSIRRKLATLFSGSGFYPRYER